MFWAVSSLGIGPCDPPTTWAVCKSVTPGHPNGTRATSSIPFISFNSFIFCLFRTLLRNGPFASVFFSIVSALFSIAMG